MSSEPSGNRTSSLLEILSAAVQVCRKARKHQLPLKGNGFYASKFSSLHVSATISLDQLRASFNPREPLPSSLTEVETKTKRFFDSEVQPAERSDLFTKIQFLLKTQIDAALQTRVHTASDAFFPLDIVRGTRGYIEKVAEQACGSYDQGWYDAAAVMARRLLETLIIETYEAHQLDGAIKKSDGAFLYLGGLVGVLLKETRFNVGRNTKAALPRLKDLGDQSAHSRRYLAKRSDLDEIKRDLRVALEELMHLSKLKK
jgi:hypothetical protein